MVDGVVVVIRWVVVHCVCDFLRGCGCSCVSRLPCLFVVAVVVVALVFVVALVVAELCFPCGYQIGLCFPGGCG